MDDYRHAISRSFMFLAALFVLAITLLGIMLRKNIDDGEKELTVLPTLASTAVSLAQPTYLSYMTLVPTSTQVSIVLPTLTPAPTIEFTTIQTESQDIQQERILNPLLESYSFLTMQSIDIFPAVITHTIQTDDRLIDLANTYQSTLSDIMIANEMFNSNALSIGQKIMIPVNSTLYSLSEYDLNLPYQWEIIGYSTGNHPIEVFTFGHGVHQIVLVGGIHGGYEWNTTRLAYETITYLAAHPETVPDNVTLHIIPSANPDGIVAIIGRTGSLHQNELPTAAQTDPTAIFDSRFNSNNVDLNRNWGCNWSEQALWRTTPIEPGPFPFSEVENQVLSQFLINQDSSVSLAVFWHSAAGIVSPGKCGEEVHPLSVELGRIYSNAAGYILQDFTAYLVTGDASDWLVTQNIASFSVELTDHYAIDWEKNLNGLQAILTYYQEFEDVDANGDK